MRQLKLGKRIWRSLSALMLLVLVGVFAMSSYGCSTKENQGKKSQEKQGNYIYFINRDETRIQGEEFTFATKTADEQILEIANALCQTPKHNELKTTLGVDFTLRAYELKEGNLTLNMDEKYKSLSPTKEVLVRAALVRSFVQVDGVNYIQFLVAGETLMDAGNMAVGLMNADSFVENDGAEINTYERVNVTLYFASEDGEHLIAGQRNVVYNTNVSMEKMVVEQLIKGPVLAGYYPTINPDTKILSVTNKDGTCYVNLSEDFLKQQYAISNDVVVYSIANSLIDLPNVSRVQIQVNGSSKVMLGQTKSLEEPIERNLDIILKEEE